MTAVAYVECSLMHAVQTASFQEMIALSVCSCLLLWHCQNVSNSVELSTVPLFLMYFNLIIKMLLK